MPSRALIEASTPTCPGCGGLTVCDHALRVWTCPAGARPEHTGLAGVTFEFLVLGPAGDDEREAA